MTITSQGDNGILFEGAEGRFFVNRSRIAGKPVEDLKDNPLSDGAIEQVYDHLQHHGVGETTERL
jgi:hypothetical protein